MKLKSDLEILNAAYQVFDMKKEVADLLNVSMVMLNNYEKGKYKLPFTSKAILVKETKRRLRMINN